VKIAYFDCFSGIAGDMILGALIDLGLSLAELQKELARLSLGGYHLETSPVTRGGIGGTCLEVIVEGVPEERHLADILDLIASSTLPQRVKERSQAIFQRLAAAEARVHRVRVDQVHFHEVGAVDAIVDVVGAVAGLELLSVGRVECSALNLGKGFTKSQHGILPVPAPATIELLQGVPVYSTNIPHELVTPTGAAITTELSARFGDLPPITLEKIGYGAGKADLPTPNLLRVILGEAEEPAAGYLTDRVTLLETNLDDMNPQFYDHVMERLFAAGALDVYLVPVQMKKNRPGVVLSVLAPEERAQALLAILLTETTTLGVRLRDMPRCCLERATRTVDTPCGQIRVKEARLGDRILHGSPEYEDCRRAATEHGVPIALVYDEARRRWMNMSWAQQGHEP
jgi:hypothetical protein